MTAATTVLSPTVGRDQLGQNKCQHKVGRYDLRGTESSNVANKPRLSVMSRDQVETDIRLWSVNPLKNGGRTISPPNLQQGNTSEHYSPRKIHQT